RKAQATKRARIRLTERYIPKLQAHYRGFLVRLQLKSQRSQQIDATPWIIVLQTAARSHIARRRWHSLLRRIAASAKYTVKIQSHCRGVLQRHRLALLKSALRRNNATVLKFQSIARARAVRNAHRELLKAFMQRPVRISVLTLQAHARGVLSRRRIARKINS